MATDDTMTPSCDQAIARAPALVELGQPRSVETHAATGVYNAAIRSTDKEVAMTANETVTVEIIGGPTFTVQWHSEMTIRDALENAYDGQDGGRSRLTYGLQYYGTELGHLVFMINENYDSFDTNYEPDFFWRMAVNGVLATKGVDLVTLNRGDVVTFTYSVRSDEADNPLERAKYAARK